MDTILIKRLAIILLVIAIFLAILTIACYCYFDIHKIYHELLNRVGECENHKHQPKELNKEIKSDKTAIINNQAFLIIENKIEIHSEEKIGGMRYE